MPQGRGCPRAGWPRNRGPQSLCTFHQSSVGRSAASSQAGGVSPAKTGTVAVGTRGRQGYTATLLQSQVPSAYPVHGSAPLGLLPSLSSSVERTESLLQAGRNSTLSKASFLELCELTPRHRSRAGQGETRWALGKGVNDPRPSPGQKLVSLSSGLCLLLPLGLQKG